MRFTKEICPAVLPAVVLFVMLPITYYTANAEDLYDIFWAAMFFGGAFISFCLLSLSLLLFKEDRRNVIVKILFTLGLYMIFADFIAPSPSGQLITGSEFQNIHAPPLGIDSTSSSIYSTLRSGFLYKMERRMQKVCVFVRGRYIPSTIDFPGYSVGEHVVGGQ